MQNMVRVIILALAMLGLVWAGEVLAQRLVDTGSIDLKLRENVRINGAVRIDDQVGYSMAYGDIDADGYDDLIIGAPFADYPSPTANARIDAGVVYVIYGDDGFSKPPFSPLHQFIQLDNSTGTPLLSSPGPATTAHKMTIIIGAEPGDHLGWSVASGNIDGDKFLGRPYQDIIIGAPFAASDVSEPDGSLAPEGGKTYVVYSLAGTLKPATVNIIDLASVPANQVTEINGGDEGIRSGWSVASGDINSDGFDEVITGAPRADNFYAAHVTQQLPNPRTEAGATYVVYGSSSLLRLPMRYLLRFPTPLSSLVEILGETEGEHSGWALAGNELTNRNGSLTLQNGDDIVIGAPDASPGGLQSAGKTYVVSGNNFQHLTVPSGLGQPTPFDLAAPPFFPTTTIPNRVRIFGGEQLARSGWAVAAGNVGSGLALPILFFRDLFIGAPFSSESGADAGTCYAFFSSVTTSIPTGSDHDLLADSDFRVSGKDAGDRLGYALASGDIDDDGWDDILIGAPFAKARGEAYVFYANNTSLGDIAVLADKADVFVLGESEKDLTGFSVAAGNINNLGGDDFAVGAPGADASQDTTDTGRAYVVYGCSVTAGFTFVGPDIPCVGQTLDFNDVSSSLLGDIVAWHWEFGDGNESFVKNPSHAFTATGAYNVKLTVRDVQGCVGSTAIPITVIAAIADFTATPDKACAGENVQFTDLSTPSAGATIVFREWTLEPGLMTNAPNPSHIYSTPGNYTVKLTIRDSNGCEAMIEKIVEIFANPEARFKWPDRKFCVGDRVKFKDKSLPEGQITGWKWDFDDTPPAMSTEQEPVHKFQTAGPHNVTLEVEIDHGNGVVCKHSKTRAIEILPADPDPPLCKFRFDPDGTLIVEIDDPGSGIATIEIVELVNGQVQNKEFKNSSKVGFDCNINDITLEITRVNPNKNMRFEIEITDCCGNVTRCDPVSLVATAAGGYERSFQVPQTDRFLQVINSGLETISLKINNQAFELVADQNRRDRVGQRQYMAPYGDVAVDLTEFLTEENNWVELSVAGPEAASALIVFADVALETASPQLPQAFALYPNYPNPFNPTTTIEFTVPESITSGVGVKLVVYNMFGQEVKTLLNSSLQAGAHAVTWDGRNGFGRSVASGIYLYRIKMGSFTQVRRMLLLK